LSTTVRYAFDRSELMALISKRHPLEFPLLLQERVVGPGVGIFLCYDHGKPIARFSHRRLREKPPTGGVSVLSESVAAAPRAREYADALLVELGWHGVAMVEFKQDQRDGSLKLMEINGRFWGSLQLAIDAGVDFPGILLEVVCGRAPASPPPYRVGVRSRWLWGDLDSLLLTLQARGNTGQTWRARMRAIGQFLRVGDKDLHYENPRWSDLRPWLYESASWFRSLSARHD
jgi:predicted ATP-grasp superfamily ATP-dependent carboligase